MADNTVLNIGSGGDTIATEDIGGVKHELVMAEFSDGAGGATKVSATDPLPVTDAASEAALLSIAAEDFATHAAQIDNSQKTQLVDAAGNPVTVTGNKLDVNAIFSGDIEIGAVELKNGTDDTRAIVTPANALKVDGSAVTQPVSGAFFQATQPVSGTFFQATQPVSAATLPLPTGAATAANQQTDALTDVELRATPVPISGTVATGGLTDAQLRATPVPVSATDLDIRNLVFATDKADVSGSTGVGVTGTFFQATQPVSAAALPLPSGASTEATLALIKAKTDNIDVALSTRTKPSDQQHVIIDSGGGGATTIADGADVAEGAIADAIVAAGAAGTVSAKLRRVTQGLEDLKAGITALPLPTGAATGAKQDTGNTSLASIDAKLTNPLPVSISSDIEIGAVELKNGTDDTRATVTAANALKVDGSAVTQPVSAASLPLPSGAATAAKQDTGNTSVASIDTKTPALGQALAAASTPVVLTAAEEAILSAILTIADFDTKTGSLTETAPATDTASSGLNGRLQRIAQRLTSLITALGSPFQAGGSIGNTSFASTIADGANVTQGAVADAAWVSGNGTIISLLKKIASAGGSAVSIADGADITEGALADAIVAAGATGSVSAKLRRVTQGLEDLKTLIVLAAGTNLIGKVGIDQTTPGTTNAVVEASAAAILAKLTAAAASMVKLEDAASASADGGVPSMAIRKATPANLSDTDGDYEMLQMSAGKLWVQAGATQKPSIGATVVLAVTALQSLANSATVGWGSVRVSNLATLATDYEIFVKLTTANTAPANDKAAYVWVCPFYTTDAGTTWFASSQGTATLPTGTDAASTIASPHNLRLLGVLNYTTQQMVLQDTFLLSNCFGNRMPDGFSIIITNFTGAALSTGCVVDYSPLNDILV